MNGALILDLALPGCDGIEMIGVTEYATEEHLTPGVRDERDAA